ncbi:MAG: MFS transporter, partial [Chloroflexota bacterium]
MPVEVGIPTPFAKRPARIFYGWWVVSAASVLYALGGGIYWSGFSFYFLPVARELGLSRTSMSLAFGLARLVAGLQGPVAGYLVDRLGPRVMIIFGGALGGLGFILLARTHSYWTFLLVYLGLMVIGFSGGFDLGIMSVANRWFVRRKGRAMSFLWVGLGLGTAFIAPAVGLMVVNLGWR